jgi:hypothetical protein
MRMSWSVGHVAVSRRYVYAFCNDAHGAPDDPSPVESFPVVALT